MEAQPLILSSNKSTDEGYPVAMITIRPNCLPNDILTKIFKQFKEHNINYTQENRHRDLEIPFSLDIDN
jgi:hypothetical protein